MNRDRFNLRKKNETDGRIIGSEKLEELQQHVTNEGLLKEAHWMLRIFPNEIDREKMRYQTEVFKIKAESEYALFKMHREAMKQSFKEALDTLLMNGKVKTRQDRIMFFTEKAKELEEHVMQKIEEFMLITNQRYERLTEIKHERLIELEGIAINQSIDNFYGSIETLMDQFHNIVDEGV